MEKKKKLMVLWPEFKEISGHKEQGELMGGPHSAA